MEGSAPFLRSTLIVSTVVCSSYSHRTLRGVSPRSSFSFDVAIGSLQSLEGGFPRVSQCHQPLNDLLGEGRRGRKGGGGWRDRKSHTSELQSRQYLVCRLLLEKKKPITRIPTSTLK
eukprot:TRINITY_DN3493_c0_g1_i1.p1 TRINITY_DN3493_c0_g1~~TRINITY_DN3493_c0_g1_i1.p1  ORF type:complete len:117 (-),score=4.82 TRINITY_DN3493_c0_g1_i1:45-395(-)